MTHQPDRPERLYLFYLATNRLTGMPIPAYLIQTTSGKHILIDSGWARDPASAAKHPAYQAVSAPEEDDILHQLARLGLTPQDIHLLICTHFDPDHAGNHDAFSQAELVVQRAHYLFARDQHDVRFAATRAHWDHPKATYRLVDGDTELVLGVELLETSGHVPGHQSVLVRLPESGPILLAIDAISQQQQSDPDQRHLGPYDMDEEGIRASTRKLMELARREQVTLIVYGHDAEQWKHLRTAPAFYS